MSGPTPLPKVETPKIGVSTDTLNLRDKLQIDTKAIKAPQFLSDAGTNITTGVKQVAAGQVKQGVTNYLAGTLGALSYGETAGILPGQAQQQRAAEDAAALANADARASVLAEATAKSKAAQTRIEEAMNLRRKTPGRAANLLSSTQNINNLFSQSKRGAL